MATDFQIDPATPADTAEGYYARRATVLAIAGTDNFNLGFNLDNDATVADEAVAQGVFDRADRYVDARARVLGVAAEAAATAPHVLATANAYFGRVSDLASAIARVDGYQLKGTTGTDAGDETRNADGQMSAMRKRAERELDEILQAVARGGGITIDGPALVVRSPRAGGPCLLPSASDYLIVP